VRWSLAAKIALGTGSLVLALPLAELALLLLWHNPYAAAAPDRFVLLPMARAGLDIAVDRKAIDPELPSVRFRADHVPRDGPGVAMVMHRFDAAIRDGRPEAQVSSSRQLPSRKLSPSPTSAARSSWRPNSGK
jgi:hypothetical protein